MASGFNKCIFLGNLGSDPQMKFLDAGNVCSFSLAINDQWTDKQGNKQQRTEWVRVSVWGKQAEVCGQYLAKGRAVLVEGKLRTTEREVDGHKRQYTECVASDVRFLDAPKTAVQPADRGAEPRRAPPASQRPQARAPGEDSFDADDVPW